MSLPQSAPGSYNIGDGQSVVLPAARPSPPGTGGHPREPAVTAVTWVRLRSWHAVRGLRTRCGRSIPADALRSADLPARGRSCERCLQLVARDADL